MRGEQSKKERSARAVQSTCRKWSEELMTGAMKGVADGLLDGFGIPRSTLKDRLSGNVHGAKPLPLSIEEDEVVKFLLTCTDIGLPKTRMEVIGFVREGKKQGM